MDGTPDVTAFADTLGRVRAETSEAGFMAKDPAVLTGKQRPFPSTQDFPGKIASNLQAAQAT